MKKVDAKALLFLTGNGGVTQVEWSVLFSPQKLDT